MNPFRLNQPNNHTSNGHYYIPLNNQVPLLVTQVQPSLVVPIIPVTNQGVIYSQPTSPPIIYSSNSQNFQNLSQSQFQSQPHFPSQPQVQTQPELPSQPEVQSQTRFQSENLESDISSEISDDGENYETDEDDVNCPECNISQVF